MTDQPDTGSLLALAECLAARLCHDVAGLASTIAGTVDMVLEDEAADGAGGEAAALAAEAAQLLALRIRLYRAAWGGGEMEPGSLADLAAGLPNRARLTLTIDSTLHSGLLSGEAASPVARLMLCILLAATAALPAGGSIAVAADGHGFSVTLAGRHAAWPDALTHAAPWHAAEARTLAAPMTALIARAAGWQLTRHGLCLTAQP